MWFAELRSALGRWIALASVWTLELNVPCFSPLVNASSAKQILALNAFLWIYDDAQTNRTLQRVLSNIFNLRI